MAITGVKAVESWGTLVELDDEGRQARLLEHYAELGGLPDDELRDRVLGIVAAECDLTDDELRAVTVSRLRVWLRLAPELVERICSTYESAVARMSADKAMRWAGILQNLRKEFSREERLRLVAIVPSAFGGVQEVDLGAFTYDEPASQKDVGKPKKRWWPFGGS